MEMLVHWYVIYNVTTIVIMLLLMIRVEVASLTSCSVIRDIRRIHSMMLPHHVVVLRIET